MHDFNSVFSPPINQLLEDWAAAGHRFWSLRRSLASFDRYCIENDVLNDLLTKELVCDWMQVEADRNIGSELGERAKAIRKLARYYIAMGKEAFILPVGYMTRYTPKRTYSIHLFSDDELAAFFAATDSISLRYEADPWVAEVAPVMFRMLYTCGLRPNEVREIKCTDVNLETGEVLIRHNKELKQRIVVMSSDMTDMCRKYLARKTIFAPDAEYLFPREKGGFYTEKLFTALFQRCWKKANPGVPKLELRQVRPYDLRHRFASVVLQNWIDEGKNLYSMLPYLSAYMGHSRISHTAYYIHILPENLLKSKGISWEEMDGIVPEVSLWEN